MLKRVAATALIAVLAAGCASGGTKEKTAEAPAAAPAKPAAKPTAAPTVEKPPSDEAKSNVRRKTEIIAALAGTRIPGEGEVKPSAPPEIVVDAKTGLRLERIPKSQAVYLKDGQVYHRVAAKGLGIPLVREDAEAYYVEAPPEKKPVEPGEDEVEDPNLAEILEYPASEGEVVAPPATARRVRFEERSEGLPKNGFWRTNMDLADLDGDGMPEIVTPPPRLTAGGPRVFKADGVRWKEIRPEVSDSEGAHFGYGGVAVGDMNADGRPDIVAIGHLAGITILFNEGDWKFRADDKGLPLEMSGRSVAVGDLNGDGRLDVVAQSDESEYTRKKRRDDLEKAGLRPPSGAATADAYVPGVDTRYFLAQADGSYRESHAGLELSCYGYSLALQAKPVDGGAPYLATSCRYSGRTQILYSFDGQKSSFVRSGLEVVERFGYHIAAAVGTYQGKPAAYATYFKTSPEGAVPSFTGHGISVYYRDGTEWKSRRVLKTVQSPPWDLGGIAVGDLDGDGLDDVVLADDQSARLRVFFQTTKGDFEELATELQPKTRNHATSVRIADLDGDGRRDVVLMYEFRSSDRSRSGGIRTFMNRLP